MKKYVLLAVTSLLILSAHSQISKDSTKLPNTQLRLALQLIAKGDACEQEKSSLQKEITLLNKAIVQEDTTIAVQDRRINVLTDIIGLHEQNEKIYDVENNALREENDADKKAADKVLRKQKAKTTLYKITTVAAIAGGAYLLLKP